MQHAILIFCIVVFCGAIEIQAEASAKAAVSGTDLLRHSDICVYAPAEDASEYEKWLVTAVPWGEGGEEADVPGDVTWKTTFTQHTAAAHKAGVRLYPKNMAFLHEMMSFRINNKEWENEAAVGYNPGYCSPSWFKGTGREFPIFCTTSAAYQAWIMERARQIGELKPDAFHMDEPPIGSTALGGENPGCFCPRCMAGFREYLKKNIPAETLAKAGVSGGLDDFDYHKFLKAKYGENLPPRQKIELWEAFANFQYGQSVDLVRRTIERVREAAGRRLPVGANAHPGDPWEGMPLMGLLDFTASEENLNGKTGKPSNEVIFHYKMGDAQGVRVVSNGNYLDWYSILKNERPALVRTWLAQAYAFGHYVVFPRNQWAWEPKEGDQFYRPEPKHYVPLAKFIRDNAIYFDGYEAAAPVALFYTRRSGYEHYLEMLSLNEQLVSANVPFRIVLVGDEMVRRPLRKESLGGPGMLAIAPSAKPTEAERAMIKEWATAGGRLVEGSPEEVLKATAPEAIKVQGAPAVVATVRKKSADAPAVCHLLNRDYDTEKNMLRPTGAFTLEIPAALLEGAATPGAEAQVISPDASPANAAAKKTENGAIQVTVPSLNEWSMVIMKP